MRALCFIVAGLLAVLTGRPVLAANCDGFTDVDSADSTYCSAVTYIKDKGITLGCTGTQYCPNNYVTRLQMALFLQRMGKGDSTNTLGGVTSAIGGGVNNTAGIQWDVVSGGASNTATGFATTVAGGYGNTASGNESSVAGGQDNTASGTFSIVVGGAHNVASGTVSIAAGWSALADRDYCAILSLWSPSDGPDMSCFGVDNIFRLGADHGFSVDWGTRRSDGGGDHWVAIGDQIAGQPIRAWNGANLTEGGAWTNASDRNAKTEIALVDPKSILDKVAALPIATWRYKAETGQVHLGPMAQDFHEGFGLGADDKHITTVDEGGVALAAIQGLNAKLEALVAQQAQELAEIKAQLAAIAAAR